MSSSPRNNYSSFAVSSSPPSDLGSYSRIMHQHTKRQMEAARGTSSRRSNHHHSQSQSSENGGTSSMLNGVPSSSRSNSPDDHGYHG